MFAKVLSRFMIVLILSGCVAQSARADIKVISKDPEARISRESDALWSCRQDGTRYVLEREDSGILLFKKESRIIARGMPKGDKLTLNTESGTVYASFKFKSDKIKCTPDGSSAEWEFKIKSGKIKVMYGGMEQGKIKFYPDTGKVKAKNRMGNTEAEFKGLSALSAAPGVYLITSADAEKRICLGLVLLMMGK